MTQYPDLKDDRIPAGIRPAAWLGLLTFGTVSVYNIPDNHILPRGILMLMITFSFLLMFVSIKNTDSG